MARSKAAWKSTEPTWERAWARLWGGERSKGLQWARATWWAARMAGSKGGCWDNSKELESEHPSEVATMDGSSGYQLEMR